MLGILGGMGPLATADFFAKLLAATPAADDAGHVPVLMLSDPRIPPRPAAILGAGESPLPALRAACDKLIAGGATVLAMPCNTAHFWYADLLAGCPMPFISIIDASCDEITSRAADGAAIGIIATPATLAAHLYDARLAAMGYLPRLPDARTMDEAVMPAIQCVKAGNAAAGGRLLAPVVEQLFAGGASHVILACTETPLALDAIASPLRDRCIDSTAALARACVAHWFGRATGNAGTQPPPPQGT
jgi:aspartate racemase